MRTVCIFCLTVLIGCSLVKIGDAQMIEGEQDCKANLMATGEYVLILQEQRTLYEKEVARLRYQINRLREENVKLLWKMEKELKK